MALKLVQPDRNAEFMIGFRQHLGIEGDIVYVGTAPILKDDGEPNMKVDRETGEVIAHRHFLLFSFSYPNRETGINLPDSFVSKYWLPGDDPDAVPFPELIGKPVDFEGEKIMVGGNSDFNTDKVKLWGSFSFTDMFEAGAGVKSTPAMKSESPKASKAEPAEAKDRFAAANNKA